MNALIREDVRPPLDGCRLHRRAHRRRRRAAGERWSRGPPRSRRRRVRCAGPRTCGAAAGSSAPRDRVAVHRPAGLLPVPQATAASCQVNNLHLLRGMLGRPGLRDPADERPAHRAEQPGVRRRRRPAGLPQLGEPATTSHELAELWNVDADGHPALGAADPCDADLPVRRAGLHRVAVDLRHQPRRVHAGTCPDPATSSPRPELFLVVQDLYLTETAQYADVVLPAAGWGEKTGTFTNASRTVHLSDRLSIRPARPAATWTSFWTTPAGWDSRHRDGTPLLPWSGTRGRVRAWKDCTPRPALRLHRASATGGCAAAAESPGPAMRTTRTAGPAIRGRAFPTDPDYCESYGHDLLTGATVGEQAYRARARRPGRPQGRGLPSPARGTRRRIPVPATPPAAPLTTSTPAPRPAGPAAHGAAPEPWVELSAPDDADRLGIAEGDMVRVTVPARPDRGPGPDRRDPAGTVFAPFHYGYWDTGGSPGAAPDSRQRTDPDRMGPRVQATDVQERRRERAEDRRRRRAGARADHHSVPARHHVRRRGPGHRPAADGARPRDHPPDTGAPFREQRNAGRSAAMNFPSTWACSAKPNRPWPNPSGRSPKATATSRTFACCAGPWPTNATPTGTCSQPVVQRYGEVTPTTNPSGFTPTACPTRSGPVGLLRDLQDLYLLASLVDITWTLVIQAGRPAGYGAARRRAAVRPARPPCRRSGCGPG